MISENNANVININSAYVISEDSIENGKDEDDN